MDKKDQMNILGIQVKIIANTYDKRVNRVISDLDLTATQSFFLHYLVDNADKIIYQKDLEQQFNIKHPTITGILKRLSDKGFVESYVDERDHRYKRVIVTEKALQVQAATRQCLDQNEAEMLSSLTEDEIAELHRLLGKVIDTIPSE